MMPGNPIVGSTVLRRPAIQSPNFVTTVSGWTINADGSAEFNNLTIRGTFQGTDFVINASGSFFYSPSEAAGNLVESVAPAADTDQFGNHYVAGHASYGAAFAASVQAGFLQFYTGSLAAGWAVSATIEADSNGNLLLAPKAGQVLESLNNTLDDGAGNATVAGLLAVGSLTVGGSSNTGDPVVDATIVTTSGNHNGGTLISHNHSYGHTHPL